VNHVEHFLLTPHPAKKKKNPLPPKIIAGQKNLLKCPTSLLHMLTCISRDHNCIFPFIVPAISIPWKQIPLCKHIPLKRERERWGA